ncbi:MAG: dihydrolipoamide acetyltransferase family protein, partial [Microbacteriaceae bacterium]
MTIVKDFALPDLGEGLTESELVSWLVQVGDTVELNQIIAEVETAKALVELPSPFAGRISKLYAEPGSTVLVGAPIVAFEVEGGDSSAPSDSSEAPDVVEPGQPVGEAVPSKDLDREPVLEREPVLVGYGPVRQGGEGAQRPKRRPRPGLDRLEDPAGNADVIDTGARVRDRDDGVPGSGPRETRIPIRGVRKHTAAAMVASAFTAPQATEFLTVDVTATMELLTQLRTRPAFSAAKLTLLTMVAKALCLAARRTPSVNSRWDEANQEIVQYHYLNLGVAVATPRGLVVPNIRDADAMDLAQLSVSLGALVEAARAGRSSPAELDGGTISITNIGVFGVDAGTPILNPGEALILAMGAVRRVPWEFRGEVALRQVMT